MTEKPENGRHVPPRVNCLLVDDLEENLLALSALLRGGDVELLQARSGLEALDLLLRHEVALAIVDVQMPDMDGFELAELMRGSERTRHVPIIFVTAGGRDQHRLFKGYDTGAVDFLHKPIEPYVLKNKCEVFFELYRQRWQLAQELRARTETLRLNEMFAAALGHDLRTPLGAILTTAALLRLRCDEPVVHDLAARITSSGTRMNRMIGDMLDLARARLAGGIPITCAPASLGAVVQRAVQEHQVASPDRRIEVELEGDDAGEWDADRLAQVASNLIGNALQHGEPDAAVLVRVDGRGGESVTFSVANAGGIDPALRPHVFDPFRGRPSTSPREGLGLGLYIAQQIARAHGGRIDITDAERRTVFAVTVPRTPQERRAP